MINKLLSNVTGRRKARYLDDDASIDELLSDCDNIILSYQWGCDLDNHTMLWILDRLLFEIRKMLENTKQLQTMEFYTYCDGNLLDCEALLSLLDTQYVSCDMDSCTLLEMLDKSLLDLHKMFKNTYCYDEILSYCDEILSYCDVILSLLFDEQYNKG